MPASGLWRKSGREKPNSASLVPSPPESKPSFWKLPEALPIWEAGSKRKLSPSAEETVIGEDDGFINVRGSSLLLAIQTGISREGQKGCVLVGRRRRRGVEGGRGGGRGGRGPEGGFFLVTSTHTGTEMLALPCFGQ